MIKSFKDSQTETIFRGIYVKGFPQDIQRRALRKLEHLDNAASLDDLSAIPGDRLEKLKGDREGQYSIRINRQWRVVFVWVENHAFEVEIVDYH